MATAQRTFGILEPKLATSLQEARRRTGLIQILRLLFTCAAVMSAGFLLGPVVNHSLRRDTQPISSAVKAITIVNPRFEGHDNADQPYLVTADSATRRNDDIALFDLFAPRMENESGLRARAREGVWDKENQVLDLAGDVRIIDAAGYEFVTQRAQLHTYENRVEGASPLSGAGPIGELRADAYEVLDSGEHIIFRGKVWTKFTSSRPRPATTTDAGAQ